MNPACASYRRSVQGSHKELNEEALCHGATGGEAMGYCIEVQD